MIYITGDKHGSFTEFLQLIQWCRYQKTTLDDKMIILGDTGINYFGSLDDILKDLLSKANITFLCVHGNHEKRPESLPIYKKKKMFGGNVCVEDKYPNIIFLLDGEEYQIDGKTFLVLGGAYSIDKFYRLNNNWNWFADEQTDTEKRIEIYNKVFEREYDYVLSHTCPYEWQPFDLFLSGIDQSTVDNSQEKWLSEIEKQIQYKHWFFGHFHGERTVDKHTMLYNDIKSL